MNDEASPLAVLEEATARAAVEFEGKAKAIAGYPQEGPPASLVGFAQVESPQHPPPPPAAPLRCRTLPHRTPRIGPFYSKKASDYGTTTPCSYLDSSSRCSFCTFPAFDYTLWTPTLSMIFFSISSYPDSYPTMRHLFLPRRP